jgi:hypothetical protein
MVEDTPGVLIEDVDIIHHYNGAFAAYFPKSGGVTYRRCRARDQILTPLGRGAPTSNYCNFISSPDANGTRFEQVKYWNVSKNLAWNASSMAAMDWASQEFTPRAPIRNQFAWK